MFALQLAAALLAQFDKIEPGDPVGDVLAQVLVLGLPASVGGAAGRAVV